MYSIVIYSTMHNPEIIIAHSKTEVFRTLENNKGKEINIYDYFDNNVSAEFINK